MWVSVFIWRISPVCFILLILQPSPQKLWIAVTLRLLYFPFFLFSNYQVLDKTRSLPVLISNDWVYWLVAATMAFTNGYFSSLGMMYAPGYELKNQQIIASERTFSFLVRLNPNSHQ